MSRAGRVGVAAAVVLALVCGRRAGAIDLDERGEMRLGLRAYTAVRVGTEEMGGDDNPLTFPPSPAGHLRQHRYFLELAFDHDLRRLAAQGWGLAALFRSLDLDLLGYTIHYRGEGEGIYDYGPDEFSEPARTASAVRFDVPNAPPLVTPLPPAETVARNVRRLRRIARQRHRLFFAYLDVEKGPLFVRLGRQVLAWGETDSFRLLDNINPLDASFGGFFIALDERRVPLDMLRASWNVGSVGPFADAFVEAFGALGDQVATNPGAPPGSPWVPGGLGLPSGILRTTRPVPAKEDFRGGARLVFTHRDVTYSLAHYWTYLDNPGVVLRVPGAPPGGGLALPGPGREIVAEQRVPRTPISGGSLTFPVPRWYSIVRGEVAWFHDEPFNRQGEGNDADALGAPGSPGFRRLARENNLEGGLDPFVFPGFIDLTRTEPIQGHLLRLDSFNAAVGLDVNRFVRWLNPNQTLFVSTQVFYKHVFDAPDDLILAAPVYNIALSRRIPILGSNPGCGDGRRGCRIRPRFLRIREHQVLHTLAVTTSYYGGQVVPFYGMFYDWQGAWVFQPGVSLVRDPFRLTVDYTRVEASIGAGALAALRDRDTARAQIEFVF